MRLVSILFLAGLVTIGGSESHAHMDRILSIDADGAIAGLPSEYGPAAMHIEFDLSTDGPAVSLLEVRLGDIVTRLPKCITDALTTRSIDGVRASASWYHDETYTPYYLALEFRDPTYDESIWTNANHNLLFNLHTGRLFWMYETVVVEKGKQTQLVHFDYAASCLGTDLEDVLDEHAYRFPRGGGTIQPLQP